MRAEALGEDGSEEARELLGGGVVRRGLRAPVDAASPIAASPALDRYRDRNLAALLAAPFASAPALGLLRRFIHLRPLRRVVAGTQLVFDSALRSSMTRRSPPLRRSMATGTDALRRSSPRRS
jgi:hypothetical protein